MKSDQNMSALEQIITVIADITDKKESELSAGTDLIQDLALDSLALYEIVIELEDIFGLQISDEDIERIRTIGEAVSYIDQHR